MTSSLPSPPSSVKRRPSPKRGPRASSGKGTGKKNRNKNKPTATIFHNILLLGLEGLGVTILGLAAIVVLLGYFANHFSGTDLVNNLLPFAGAMLGLILCGALFLSGWQRFRGWLLHKAVWLPAVVMLTVAAVVGFSVPRELFIKTFGYYRTLVGGKEEASRVTLAHQVYAAYRRLDTGQLATMVVRAEPYRVEIEEAAAASGLDSDLLKGLAATESSFLPRKSADGGHGLFQITQAPAAATAEVNRKFTPESRQLADSRYNAHLGAATLRHYLGEMKGDLFLGLLAYNIGPANGGLRFIMQQYGVTDFVTIQPYLLQLPRDYPIRVLAYALAFRIARMEGKLLPYEEGKNGLRIQSLGIPGL